MSAYCTFNVRVMYGLRLGLWFRVETSQGCRIAQTQLNLSLRCTSNEQKSVVVFAKSFYWEYECQYPAEGPQLYRTNIGTVKRFQN
jgi:hypothetical protein